MLIIIFFSMVTCYRFYVTIHLFVSMLLKINTNTSLNSQNTHFIPQNKFKNAIRFLDNNWNRPVMIEHLHIFNVKNIITIAILLAKYAVESLQTIQSLPDLYFINSHDMVIYNQCTIFIVNWNLFTHTMNILTNKSLNKFDIMQFTISFG